MVYSNFSYPGYYNPYSNYGYSQQPASFSAQQRNQEGEEGSSAFIRRGDESRSSEGFLSHNEKDALFVGGLIALAGIGLAIATHGKGEQAIEKLSSTVETSGKSEGRIKGLWNKLFRKSEAAKPTVPPAPKAEPVVSPAEPIVTSPESAPVVEPAPAPPTVPHVEPVAPPTAAVEAKAAVEPAPAPVAAAEKAATTISAEDIIKQVRTELDKAETIVETVRHKNGTVSVFIKGKDIGGNDILLVRGNSNLLNLTALYNKKNVRQIIKTARNPHLEGYSINRGIDTWLINPSMPIPKLANERGWQFVKVTSQGENTKILYEAPNGNKFLATFDHSGKVLNEEAVENV